VVNNEGIETGPGPVYENNDIPSWKEIRRAYRKYFQDYLLYSGKIILSYTDLQCYWYQKDDEKISKTDLESSSDTDLSDHDLYITVAVIYHKSHIPFPVPLSKEEEMEKKIKYLESKNNEMVLCLNSVTIMYQEKSEQYERMRRHMRIERRNHENKYKNMCDKMQKKFSEFYSEKKEKDCCPVCYEDIESETLRVPGCCHTICTDCADKCDKCPICRENY
jgi:hypothetical protein